MTPTTRELHRTMVHTRRLALLGRHEPVTRNEPENAWIDGDINAWTIGNADRYMYSASDDFRFVGAGGLLLNFKIWLAWSRTARSLLYKKPRL